jgi:Putative transposase DNA-binding domain
VTSADEEWRESSKVGMVGGGMAGAATGAAIGSVGGSVGTVAKADRFFASTRRCSVCGEHTSTLTLNDRVWVCSVCQMTHDRDLNAAINLHKLPLEQGKVTPLERRVPAGVRPRKPKRSMLG